MRRRSLVGPPLVCTRLALAQGPVLLVGGGSEDYNDWSDAPYRWLVEHAANRRVLILHYSDPSSFLPDYFASLGALEATNLVISSRVAANDFEKGRRYVMAAPWECELREGSKTRWGGWGFERYLWCFHM